MSETLKAGSTCAVHGRRQARTTCVSCGAAACGDCVVSTRVGYKCRSCVGEGVVPKRSERRGRRTAGESQGRPAPSPRRRRLVGAGLAAAVVVAAVAGYLATRGGDQSSLLPHYATGPAGGRAAQTATDLSVQFAGSGGLELGANLLLPPGAGPRTPGVLIVPNGGPTDRDGISPADEPADPLYLDLAQSMATSGIASLRYDRRGQAQSILTPGQAVTLPAVVGDAKGGLGFLAGRADVDHRRLAVVGDGQGGLVALQLAAQDPRVAAVVLVSTPGRRYVDTLADQVMASAPTPALGQSLVAQLRSVVAAMVAGGPEPSPAQLPAPLQPLFPPGQDAYLRAVFELDPVALASQVHVPVLIVQGGQDPALSIADSQALMAALGPRAQLLAPAQDGMTLNVVPATAPGTNNRGLSAATDMPAFHSTTGQGGVRDPATVSAVTRWLGTHLP